MGECGCGRTAAQQSSCQRQGTARRCKLQGTRWTGSQLAEPAALSLWHQRDAQCSGLAAWHKQSCTRGQCLEPDILGAQATAASGCRGCSERLHCFPKAAARCAASALAVQPYAYTLTAESVQRCRPARGCAGAGADSVNVVTPPCAVGGGLASLLHHRDSGS